MEYEKYPIDMKELLGYAKLTSVSQIKRKFPIVQETRKPEKTETTNLI